MSEELGSVFSVPVVAIGVWVSFLYFRSKLNPSIKAKPAGIEVAKEPLLPTIYEDDVFEISYDMCKKTLELLQIYSGVIIDHVITSERIFYEFWEVLGQLEILFVKVTCPLEILEKRELERKNRCLGSAKSSYTYLYPKDDYDLVVDTDSMTLKECCEVIFKKII